MNLQPWQMLALAIIAIGSLLFHELGHALAAKKFGRSPEITLEGFGGYASYDGRGMSDKQHFTVTLCGPLFTAILIGAAHYVLKVHLVSSFPPVYFFYILKRINIFWLFVNMAPLLPLDGGKILEYLMIKWLGPDTGRKYCLILGNITAIIGLSYFLTEGYYMFAYIFLFHGWKNLQMYASEYKTKKPSEFNTYNSALAAIQNNETETAQGILKKLIKSKNEYVRHRSIESLAQILEEKGDKKAAFAILKDVDPEKLNYGKWLLCTLAYDQGNYTLIQKYAGEIYEKMPTFETAALNAKAFAHLGNHEYSVGWLNTAIQFKEIDIKKIEALLNDPALKPIRAHPGFPSLV
jgi:Zn-dependent protease